MKSMRLALTAALCATASLAQPAECPPDDTTFEVGVPQTDMDTCPEAVAGTKGAYCHYIVAAEVLTIFAFDAATGCLRDAKGFCDDEFTANVC